MPAPDSIRQLVEKFKENYAAYHAEKYNEAQLRQEFVDKFFEALGWDVYNKNGVAPDYRDVVVEDSLEIDGGSKAPDYAFKIGKERKFYVEAKKPKVDIQYDIHPAYQLKRYAWNAHMPLSILTDFEELAVYNCKNKPNPGDSAATGRDLFFRYTDYVERWDEIAGLFSKEAVWKGAFDRFAETTKGKKGTTGVDDAILDDIENWRKLLALNIALRNPQVADEHQLNYAVQMTIDRILFLRICEDRGIEPEEQLQGIAKTAGIYPQLVDLFRRADLKYNSGLFHFNKEKGNDGDPDSFTPGLKIDDKVLKEIIGSIYYPCPYIFKEIPVEILGQVYEQFLGRVVRLTAGHQARIEEKPEVRKAGGVYYTPKYIVDYIVQNTVGKLLEGKTPAEAADLKIVDPACGSGSFLLGAFQHLIDWHEQWYNENEPEKWARGKSPALLPAGGGGWKLTTARKKEILVNNIYGVDIDAQAVEVTKLSLLLKVLEEESGQLSLGLERALPDLGRNIRCGNSLIGQDYYDGRQMPIFGDAEFYRVNPFDWKAAFPQVFAKGGFDAVIGNPPYIRIQALKEWAPQEVEFYKQRYRSASKGNYDIYVVFVEKGLSLLNESGRLGLILPHKFFNAQYGQPLRGLIAEGKNLAKVVHFGDLQVFENATTYTCLIFLEKTGYEKFEFEKISNLQAWQLEGVGLKTEVSIVDVTDEEWNFTVGDSKALFTKIHSLPNKLGDVAYIFVGLQTSADKIFVLKEISKSTNSTVLVKSSDGKEWEIERNILKPFIYDAPISTYTIPQPTNWLIFPYQLIGNKAQLIPSTVMSKTYPLAWGFLKYYADILRNRENGKWKHDQWYAFGRSQNLTQMYDPKLIIQVISKTGKYAFDDQGIYFTGGGNGPYYGLRLNDQYPSLSIHYIQALVNSKLLDAYLHSISSPFQGGYWSYGKRFIEQLPIRTIDFNDPVDMKRHDRMVALVESMLALHKQLAVANTPHEKELLQRQIASTDRQIDALVYELYGLTEEEIKIVEGGE